MKKIVTILIAAAVFLFSGCSKKNTILPISGTINGVPAETLYGNSNKLTDYVLIITSSQEISYNGQLYYYSAGATPNDIYITVSITDLIGATLVTVGSKTTLTITSATTFFASPRYTSN